MVVEVLLSTGPMWVFAAFLVAFCAGDPGCVCESLVGSLLMADVFRCFL